MRAYVETAASHGGRDVWRFCPPELVENQELVMGDANYVYRFLTAPPEENQSRTHRYYVRRVEGAVTALAHVKDAYRNYMKFKHPDVRQAWPEDETTLKRLGYEIETVNICKSCGQRARGGHDACCAAYGVGNRCKRVSVVHLELVAEESVE